MRMQKYLVIGFEMYSPPPPPLSHYSFFVHCLLSRQNCADVQEQCNLLKILCTFIVISFARLPGISPPAALIFRDMEGALVSIE